ncbi:MAG: hypothetical protein MUF33_02210 [Candidatus Nanopelagicales bacterium]|jgi:hypothetical protein|nr:hypothetical protein [Candidatus Nanopelagicales bacterium]
MTHCAECCYGTGVVADPDCPKHGEREATTPTERHARNLARLAELEAIRTPRPWWVPVGEFDRDIRPAVLALIRGVIERHRPSDIYPGECSAHLASNLGGVTWPCADYLAAENALGVGDE